MYKVFFKHFLSFWNFKRTVFKFFLLFKTFAILLCLVNPVYLLRTIETTPLLLEPKTVGENMLVDKIWRREYRIWVCEYVYLILFWPPPPPPPPPRRPWNIDEFFPLSEHVVDPVSLPNQVALIIGDGDRFVYITFWFSLGKRFIFYAILFWFPMKRIIFQQLVLFTIFSLSFIYI